MKAALSRSFQAELIREWDETWGRHVNVPHAIAEEFKKAGISRITCALANHSPFHCALMPQGLGQTMILFSKQKCAQFQVEPGEILELTITEDRSKYGMEMPEELEFILSENPEIADLFEALTPGKQRNLIHTVASVKSPDIRIRKALVVSEHLFIHDGKIDFKALYNEMKAAECQSEERVMIAQS